MKYEVMENEAHEKLSRSSQGMKSIKINGFLFNDASWWIRTQNQYPSESLLLTEQGEDSKSWFVNKSPAIVQCICVSPSNVTSHEWKLKHFIEHRDEQKWTKCREEVFEFILIFCDFYCTNLHDSRGKCFLALNSTFYYDFFRFRVQFMCLLQRLMGFYECSQFVSKNKFPLLLVKFTASWTRERLKSAGEGTGNCN